MPQSTVGRIESGAIDPRASTLDRLLNICGFTLESTVRLGDGIDRTQLRGQLGLTPRQRIESMAAAANNVNKALELVRRR